MTACCSLSAAALRPAARHGSLRIAFAAPRPWRSTARRPAFVVRAGDEDDKLAEDPSFESLFSQELQRRGIPNSSTDEEVGAGAAAGSTPRPQAAPRSPFTEAPRGPSASAPRYSDTMTETSQQLKRSRELNSEGLEGFIPRATELLKLGLSFSLSYAPFFLAVGLSFWACYAFFGTAFIHGGSPTSGPPPYIDPELLLNEPTADPMVPLLLPQ